MEYIRFAIALLFVLGLIGGCAWLGKRMGLTARVRGGPRAGRLSITEVQSVDARRKLVLIRRDDKEHLVLLNGERDLLIESGIEAATAPETLPHTGLADRLPRILPFIGKSPA